MGSTTDTGGFAGEERQGLVNLYVLSIIQLLMNDPRISTEQMMGYLTWAGPWNHGSQILRVFRGRPNFRQTLDRVDVIRQAVARDELRELPITSGP